MVAVRHILSEALKIVSKALLLLAAGISALADKVAPKAPEGV